MFPVNKLTDKKPECQCEALTEEKTGYIIRAQHYHSPPKPLTCLAQEMGVSQGNATTATKFFKTTLQNHR
jgi:hypothetical protein